MKVNQRKIGSILSYVTIFVKALITIIYTPIMIKYLGDAEFGIYNLSYSVISYLALLSLGFGGAYVRFYYRYYNKDDKEGIAKLNGLFIALFTIISIVSLIAGYFLIKNIDLILKGELSASELELSATLMKIMVINIAFTFPDSVFNSYITAKENFVFQKIIDLIRNILSPLIGIPLLMMGYRSIGLSIAITIATIFSLCMNIYYSMIKLGMRFSFKGFDKTLLKEISIFSSYIFIGMIIDQLNWQLDKIVLGKLVGSIAVAIYSVGAMINQYYMQFSISVSNVFIPMINNIAQSNDDDKVNKFNDIFIKVGRIQFYILMFILLGFLSVGKYFVTKIWVGDSYHDAFYVALILIIPVTIPLIQNIGIEIQKSINKHKFRSLAYLFISIFNVLLSIPLAKIFGPIGSALGTGISTLVGNGFVMNWYYKNKIGLNIKRFWKEMGEILKGMLIPIILAIFFSFINIKSNLQFLLFAIVIVLTYFVFIWKFSFNDYEKNLFKKPFNKLLKKKN